MIEQLLAQGQHALPQKSLSKLAHWVTHNPKFAQRLINKAIKHYKIDLSDAEHDLPTDYMTFHEFFTRRLKPTARPIDNDPAAIISPCDGTISQIGRIKGGRMVQAKGFEYSFLELINGEGYYPAYKNGHFTTIYLAPGDYHRVHMPCDGILKGMTYIPGRLYSVNNNTAKHIPNLYTRNERIVAHFSSDNGDFMLVLVGACLVGSINTSWAGTITPPHKHEIVHTPYQGDECIEFKRGDEMGYFSFGSTVIALFSEGMANWIDSINNDQSIKMGQTIGKIN